MVGLGRFELPTHGLGNHFRPVPPVRHTVFSVGCPASHVGKHLQFGQEYAPQNAPPPNTGFHTPATPCRGFSFRQRNAADKGGSQ